LNPTVFVVADSISSTIRYQLEFFCSRNTGPDVVSK